jgi:hypothetical protein
MAYNLEELRRAMRRGHPRGEMLDGTPFHARAACRVVFSPEGFPVEGMELVEIETWLKPGTVAPRPRGGRVRLPPLTLPASPTKAERTWAELHPMDRPEGPLGPSAHRTRGRSGRRHHSLQLPT